MDNIIEAGQITTGIDVYGADGARVGTVTATQTDYVIVSTVDGDVLLSNTYELPATECHIPISAIGNADDRAVYLNVASDEVVALGWNTAPDYRSAATGAVGESAVDTGRATGDYQNLTAVWVNDSTASIEFDSPAMEPEEASGVRRSDGFAHWAEDYDPTPHAEQMSAQQPKGIWQSPDPVDDGAFGSTSNIRFDKRPDEPAREDARVKAADQRNQAVRNASAKRGGRTRTSDGRTRTKRGETLVGTIEEQYNVDFGVRSDMHLSTLLAQRGVDSLNELLREVKRSGSAKAPTQRSRSASTANRKS